MSDRVRMPGVPDAQRDPVLRRYPLRRHRIPVGPGQLSIVIPDDRAWLREGTWAHDVLRGKEPPYWCRIWPSAVAVARQFIRASCQGEANIFAGLRVLDLGCGLGVPGVQAAALGAALCSVDFESDALSFAHWNAKAQPGCLIPPTTQQVDWARGAVSGSFDLILLSDVTYHRNHHMPVRRQIAMALADGGCVLHADPGRELSTHFLSQQRGDFAQASWQRATRFLDRKAEVRLTLLARTATDLQTWCDRLCVPTDERTQVVPLLPAIPGNHTCDQAAPDSA
ncbi:MAG TPA: methyltransferase domain-containing protein [Planctomycetes bacterium]|nr:methyltransferase domain-containing protein [Planctomycetota bacterium]